MRSDLGVTTHHIDDDDVDVEDEEDEEEEEVWKGTSSMSTSMAISCDNSVDEIVQDHDNFGVDELIDEDSQTLSNDATASSVSNLPLRTLNLPSKRKSEVIDDDEGDQNEPVEEPHKKQCVEQQHQQRQQQQQNVIENRVAAVKDRAPVVVVPLVMPTPSRPDNLEGWLSEFNGWNHHQKITALDALIAVCQPSQVRHMMTVIEPQFQRDFISLFPKELALYVLSYLPAKDLLRAAQTCTYWRILCEDNLLWREKCRESGLLADDNLESTEAFLKVMSKRALNFKATFMRHHNIEMNWRQRLIRPGKVLKGHDDHVITCLEFHRERIVSGSDDNTLKVRPSVDASDLY